MSEEIKTKKSFAQGLLEFLKQYSVIGLAIGVITGQASKDLVDAIVKGVFTPVIKLIVPSSFTDLTFSLGGQVFDIGLIINAGLTFVIIMVFLYFIIKLVQRKDELLDKK
jgi:large-conductance mechanosensitive channel